MCNYVLIYIHIFIQNLNLLIHFSAATLTPHYPFRRVTPSPSPSPSSRHLLSTVAVRSPFVLHARRPIFSPPSGELVVLPSSLTVAGSSLLLPHGRRPFSLPPLWSTPLLHFSSRSPPLLHGPPSDLQLYHQIHNSTTRSTTLPPDPRLHHHNVMQI